MGNKQSSKGSSQSQPLSTLIKRNVPQVACTEVGPGQEKAAATVSAALPSGLRQPGKPVVKLAIDRKSYRHRRKREERARRKLELMRREANNRVWPGQEVEGEIRAEDEVRVSDDILLKWAPCPKNLAAPGVGGPLGGGAGFHGDWGYEIEMWDLGLQEWVHVATTEGRKPECVLSNVLAGILYRFRVTAISGEDGAPTSYPSDPSDAFVLDMPGVNIAPYWIQTPPTIVSLTSGQALTLQAKALGTPAPNFHWYRRRQHPASAHEEELFLGQRVSLDVSGELIQLEVSDMGPADAGVYTCTAVNTIGKCSWETTVDLRAKPAFASLPAALREEPLVFEEDEVIRVKLALRSSGVPRPTLTLEKLGRPSEWEQQELPDEEDDDQGEDASLGLQLLDDYVIIRAQSARVEHSGLWRVTASNPIGSDSVCLAIMVQSRPDPPMAPRVTDFTNTSVSLSWTAGTDQDSDGGSSDPGGHHQAAGIRKIGRKYQVEYNREQWDIWLKGGVTEGTRFTIRDLIPGSYYRFRVRTVTDNGVSEPSEETAPHFLGQPPEDELFGLPGGNYPKEHYNYLGNAGSSRGHRGGYHGNRRNLSWNNLDQASSGVDSHSPAGLQLGQRSETNDDDDSEAFKDGGTFLRRKASLDREVYYLDDDLRREVVTYCAVSAAGPGGYPRLGGDIAKSRGLTPQEEQVYRSSLGSLCAQIARASSRSSSMARSRSGSMVVDHHHHPTTDCSSNSSLVIQSQRSSSIPDIERVFDRMGGSQPKGKVLALAKYEVTPTEKRVLESSLSELCNRLKTISMQTLSLEAPEEDGQLPIADRQDQNLYLSQPADPVEQSYEEDLSELDYQDDVEGLSAKEAFLIEKVNPGSEFKEAPDSDRTVTASSWIPPENCLDEEEALEEKSGDTFALSSEAAVVPASPRLARLTDNQVEAEIPSKYYEVNSVSNEDSEDTLSACAITVNPQVEQQSPSSFMQSLSGGAKRPKLAQLKATFQSTSAENTATTDIASDYATDYYYSDISCDVPE